VRIKSRIEALEARHRERAEAEAPPQRQHCERDDTGHVIACERLTWPSLPEQERLRREGVAAMAIFSMMDREPFSRASCPYSDCENRAGCRADGSRTRWGMNP
jgi:hypothetical protein